MDNDDFQFCHFCNSIASLCDCYGLSKFGFTNLIRESEECMTKEV